MKVILFDGVCNMCNGLVNWLLDHDKKNLFKFASLQSGFGIQTVKRLNLTGDYMDTVVYLDGDKAYTRSEAILRICAELGGIYSLFSVFMLIPAAIRDFFYRLVADNRYKWFGKRETCRMPEPELKSRFLE